MKHEFAKLLVMVIFSSQFIVEPKRGGPNESYPEYQVDLFSCTATANAAVMTGWSLNSNQVLIGDHNPAPSDDLQNLQRNSTIWTHGGFVLGCLHATCTCHEPQYEVGSSISGSHHTHMSYRLISHPPVPTSEPGSREPTWSAREWLKAPSLASIPHCYIPSQLFAISHFLVDPGATNYLVPICGWGMAHALCVYLNDTAIGRHPCVATINLIQLGCDAPAGRQKKPCRPFNL
jgi:hypothetical protein